MNLKDPRTQLSWLLILIFLSASFFYKDISLLKNLVIAISSAIIFDFLFLKLRKTEFFPPAAAITTGLILSLLMSPSLPSYELIIACGLAMFSKNFIKGFNRHIFNPAGFGALITSFIFGHSVSWWGVSFQSLTSIYFLVLILPLIISVIRLRRFKIIIPFIITYSLLIFLLNKTSIINNLTDPTVAFFSLVMLPEPQTTPNKPDRQILFGVFVAAISLIISKTTAVLDPLILSLLASNLLFYKLK